MGRFQNSEFTLGNYVAMVQGFVQAGYEFCSFSQVARTHGRPGRFLLMRHDIDFDVHAAEKMAQSEAGLGIRSTFFFLLRTPFYNVFNLAETEAIHRIIAMGHEIGLHFDRGAYPADMASRELAGACRKESAMLGSWFDVPISAISYHRPGPVEIEGRAENSFPLLNSYMPEFTRDITYRSDSGGQWRYGHPMESEAFQRGEPLQLLIHPIWWTDEPTAPLEVLTGLQERIREAAGLNIALNCKVYRTGPYAYIQNP